MKIPRITDYDVDAIIGSWSPDRREGFRKLAHTINMLARAVEDLSAKRVRARKKISLRDLPVSSETKVTRGRVR